MHKRFVLVPSLALILSGCSSWFINQDTLHLMKAEELSRQGKYPEAISEYEQHMRHRLELKKRPEWENPYFYLILIGDLELMQDKPEVALQRYQEAEQKGVDSNLISDRFRSLAHWHETRGRLEHAVSLLKERREKDPILIDAMLDRLSKQIVAKEEMAEKHHGK